MREVGTHRNPGAYSTRARAWGARVVPAVALALAACTPAPAPTMSAPSGQAGAARSPARPAPAASAATSDAAPTAAPAPPVPAADAAAANQDGPGTAPAIDASSETGGAPAPAPGDTGAAMEAAAEPLGAFPLAGLANAKPALVAPIAARVEGPSWRAGDVFFAADGSGLVRADAEGKLYKYHPTLNPVGSFALADGSVLICEKKYILLQMFADGKLGVLVGEGAGPTFCNDVTADGDGNLYFSDPRAGAIMRLTPAGELTRVVAGRRYTNGVEVDRESKYLYFSDTGVNQVFRVPLGKPDAAVENLGAMIADGMAFDAWGHLWLAQVTAGVAMVYDPSKKQVIARVGLGGPEATNLTFGGPNNDVVFSTVANRGLYRVPVGVRGFRHPGAPKYTVKAMLDLVPANTPVN